MVLGKKAECDAGYASAIAALEEMEIASAKPA